MSAVKGPLAAGRYIIGAAVAGLALLQSGCPPESQLTWRFQCPEDYVAIQGFDSNENLVDTIQSIPLSGPITNIPEYHDCQRFISQGVYGSVYAIFAAFRLDAMSSATDVPIPVATIYTPDGTYSALGIEPGFNCLLLSKVAEHWSATMVPRGQGKENADCSGHPSSANEKTLEVKEQTVTDAATFGPNDFPPVARWDWDSIHGTQYIGIRCGAAWCEVGAEQFTPSLAYSGELLFDPIPGISFSNTASLRVQRIKGWYDEQLLSDPAHEWRQPGIVRGLLIPHPALDTISWPLDDPPDHAQSLGIYRDRWVHVAFALVSGNYSKWHFTKSDRDTVYGKNKIYLCYGTSAPNSCNVPAATPGENPSSVALDACYQDPTDPSLRWWSRTISSTGGVSYGCVKRRDHGEELKAWRLAHPSLRYGIPGAARWKFLLNDESTWVSCPSGCCTKQ